MPRGVPLTQEAEAQRRQEIRDAALALFVAKGYRQTSMREVAEASGAGKSTLYDYFRTKEEILASILDGAMAAVIEQLRTIAGSDAPPDARLRQIMAANLAFMQNNANLNLRLSMESRHLTPEHQRRLQERRYEHQDLVGRVIQDGIDQGRFRRVDPLVAARMLLTAMQPVLFTTRPTGSSEEMLAETVEIFMRGISQ